MVWNKIGQGLITVEGYHSVYFCVYLKVLLINVKTNVETSSHDHKRSSTSLIILKENYVKIP